ncbi:MAG: hypothetical protein WC505_02330 [Patescibacteria group bacterium]
MNEQGDEVKENADWTASSEPETAFELMNPPEAPKGGSVEFDPPEFEQNKVPEAPADGVYRHVIKDAAGKETYRREASEGSDWQRTAVYDGQDRLAEVRTQKPMPGKESDTKITYKYEGGLTIATGSLNAGPGRGREWETTTYQREELSNDRQVEIELNTITKQGEDPNGPAEGTMTKKFKFFEAGKFVNEVVIDPADNSFIATNRRNDPLPGWALEYCNSENVPTS